MQKSKQKAKDRDKSLQTKLNRRSKPNKIMQEMLKSKKLKKVEKPAKIRRLRKSQKNIKSPKQRITKMN